MPLFTNSTTKVAGTNSNVGTVSNTSTASDLPTTPGTLTTAGTPQAPNFNLVSQFTPTGDQPQAIQKLVNRINTGNQFSVLLGVTGSGKTFTVANVIEQVKKPTLIISHNKTLAAQLYQEFKEFFPHNAVHYFVSYYDYYQPEAYLPAQDIYIEKDAQINEQIDKLRLATTAALLSRKDVIVVASVSAIYNVGSPVAYRNAVRFFKKGQAITQFVLQRVLVDLLYERNDYDFKHGTFRIRGNRVEVYIPHSKPIAVRFEWLTPTTLGSITLFDPLTGKKITDYKDFVELVMDHKGTDITELAIYPAKHYVIPENIVENAIDRILQDLDKRVAELKKQGKELEARRLHQRTMHDIEMIRELGYCKGIENYSVYFDGRQPGDPPYTLIDYFPEDYLLVIDESHMTIPQIRGMYHGDYSRKKTLIEYGFRLPTALDNRPLKFEEFEQKMGYTIFMSATPAEYELKKAGKAGVVEQLIRPTGIVDPKVYIRPAKDQVQDIIAESKKVVEQGDRVLIITLTKRMAESLTEHFQDLGFKVAYLHSDIDTLERTEILQDLREGTVDILIGINLLREGIDLPEVRLVAILDADQEGFLRSTTSLIQLMGRAARHIKGYVILYADTVTKSIKEAVAEVERRRKVQIEYNKKHNITPKPIKKAIKKGVLPTSKKRKQEEKVGGAGFNADQSLPVDLEPIWAAYKTASASKRRKILKFLRQEMNRYAEILDFENAIRIRDFIRELEGKKA